MGLKPEQLRLEVDEDAPKSPFGLIQVALFFCAQPETLPVFIEWYRTTTGKEPPITDEEIQLQLIALSDWMHEHIDMLLAVRTAEKYMAAKARKGTGT